MIANENAENTICCAFSVYYIIIALIRYLALGCSQKGEYRYTLIRLLKSGTLFYLGFSPIIFYLSIRTIPYVRTVMGYCGQSDVSPCVVPFEGLAAAALLLLLCIK